MNIGCFKTTLLTTEIGQYRNQASIEAAPWAELAGKMF
jgi:hypothetical protein